MVLEDTIFIFKNTTSPCEIICALFFKKNRECKKERQISVPVEGTYKMIAALKGERLW